MSRATTVSHSLLAAATLLGVAACGPSQGETQQSAYPTSTNPTTTSPASPSGSSSEGDAMGFTNPVFAANFPDPQIVADGKGYLAIATNGNGMNVQTLTSPDMVDWTQGVDALPKLASWSGTGKVWAPEIIAWPSGGFRLFYTTRAPDLQWQCVSVASAQSAAGPYTDASTKPIVCEIDEGGSIDASPFVDQSGKAWLFWKNDGNAIGRETWIKVQPLAADGLTLTGKPTKLFKETEPWEGKLVEGPAVVEVDGIFHMLYSANDYGSPDYAMGHAWATSPTGPWTKDPEPVMTANEVAAGPGHCQFIKVGDQWWIVYHAWVPGWVGDEVTGRQMWLSKVSFTGKTVTVEPPTVDHADRP